MASRENEKVEYQIPRMSLNFELAPASAQVNDCN